MIIGRDLLGELGIIMNFNDHTVNWDTDTIPMKDRGILSSVEALIKVYMSANKSKTLRDEYSRATKILDAEYKPASLDVVIKICENHHVEEQHQLNISPQKFEKIFDGKLGEFNMEPISLQLMDPNCKPIHARAYTVPKSAEQQLHHSKKILRLVDIGVLEEETEYSSEWASPSFAIPKKNGTIRVVTHFRKLNLLLKHQPFPVPKIGQSDMIRSMEGFSFASALDLNMGYYHIKLDADAQNLCTIVLYKHLPMGIKIT
jgi:hypothetical protein